MHVTLRHVRAAVGVAREGSFRRAAEGLHLSQPALSLAVSELEGQLGVKLFDRTSRSVTPTELGSAFIASAARLLDDFDQLVQEVGDVAQSRRGRVVVSCVSSLAGRVMPLAMQACSRLHPQVEVVVRDDVAQQVLASVRSREADFGLTIEPRDLEGDMSFEALKEDPFYLVCQHDHRLARRRQICWRDLNAEALVSLSTTSGSERVISDELARQHVRPARTTAVSHLSTVHGMLEAGYGVAVLPMIALPVEGHPTLVTRPLVEPKLARVIGAYRRRDRSLSPAATALLDVVRDVLRIYAAPVRGKTPGASIKR
jgi:DNA-binding transcriptional LysR family regulator